MQFLKGGFYNSIVQNIKLVRVISYSLFLLIMVFYTILARCIFDDQNLYYYVFSTIIQGFLALVAFLGAVVIYKLQLLEIEMGSFADKIRPTLEKYLGERARVLSQKEIDEEIEKIKKSKENDNCYIATYFQLLEQYSNNVPKLRDEKGLIRSKMVDFSIISFFNVGFCLISLPLSRLVVDSKLYFVGEALVLIGFLISYVSLLFAFRIIRIILGYSFSI